LPHPAYVDASDVEEPTINQKSQSTYSAVDSAYTQASGTVEEAKLQLDWAKGWIDTEHIKVRDGVLKMGISLGIRGEGREPGSWR